MRMPTTAPATAPAEVPLDAEVDAGSTHVTVAHCVQLLYYLLERPLALR